MSWIWITVAVVVTLVIYRWLQGRNKTPLRLPPGPSLVECFRIMIGCLSRDSSVEIAERLTAKYGEICVIRFLGQNYVYLNSSRMVRKLFAETGYRGITVDRPPAFLHGYLFKGGKDIAFSNYNSEVVKLRKIMHNHAKLYGEGILEFEQFVGEELKKLEKILEKGVHKENFDLKKEFVQSISHMMHIFITNQQPSDEVVSIIEEFNASFNEVLSPNKDIILSLFPWIRCLPGANRRLIQKSDNSSQRLLKFYLSPEAKQSVQGNGGLIDKLLTEQKSDPELTDEYIQGTVIDAAAAGFILTVSFLSGFFLLMLHYPEVQHRIQEELDEKIKGRQPNLRDRSQLHYTNAAILEAFRYMRLEPIPTPHQNTEDLEIDSYRIPARSVIFANLWSICRGKELWGCDDEEFNPRRFLDENGELLHVNHAYRQQLLSFGIGKRSCVGETFAKSRLFLYVTSLLQKYEFHRGNNKLVSDNSAFWEIKLARHPQFVKCKITKRPINCN